jgi:hypothetical protein
MFKDMNELLRDLHSLEFELEVLNEMLDQVESGQKELDLLMEREDVLTRIDYTLDDLHELIILED